MALINVSNLTFAYNGSYDKIFQNVSFQIDTDWKLGFTGRNGRGKTTFLKLLLGEYDYSGSITAPVAFEYFPYELPHGEHTTGTVLAELCPEAEPWQIERELSLLEVGEETLERPFCSLSNGERTKALLAGMFLRENRFLLIDEPTNHLDMRGRELVSRYLNGKKGFILVSHDRSFLDGCVDHILSINRTNIEIQRGNFSTWLQNKEYRDNFELAENEKLRREIRRLEETAAEKASWSDKADRRKVGIDPMKVDMTFGHRPLQAAKAKKSMARAKAIEKRQQAALEEKAGLLHNIESADELKITQEEYFRDTLLELRDVGIAYDRHSVCQGVTFAIHRGDRVALRGANGAGKSSIIRLICGMDVPHSGTVEIGSRLSISLVPQDASTLSGDLTEYARSCGIDESLFKAILRKLDFSRTQFEKDMSNFSAGQRKKVLIARSLCERAHLHIWDEPMNYIDVISRMQIEELLLRFKPTLLFVEHDKAFCDCVANKTVELKKSGV